MHDLLRHRFGDMLPDPGRATLKLLCSLFDKAVIPAVEGGGGNADLGKSAPDLQMRRLLQADDFELLRG
jgi:hypothetical protein